MAEGKFEKLNVTRDELSKFSKALEDERFCHLFREYVREISDPVSRKTYEDEITQLEKERGRDVIFVRPKPGYVLKTTSNGDIKTYVNFCTNDRIAKYSSSKTESRNTAGVHLWIPHSVSPLQTGYDKSNKLHHIYTVVFHPETLTYARDNKEVEKAVRDTAFDGIQNKFNTRLHESNFIVCKKSHKGNLQPTLIPRRDIPDNGTGVVAQNGHPTAAVHQTDDYVKPSFSLVYRNEVDLQNCTNDVFSKLNALVPTHMVVEIKLPLLDSVENTKLDVTSSSLYLQNDLPAKYKLRLPLPYDIQEHRSTAKFDQHSHILRLELPVKRKSPPNGQSTNREIVQPNSNLISEISDKLHDLKVDPPSDQTFQSNRIDRFNQITFDRTFLRSDVKYKLPEYFCNYYQNKIAFVLKVKNVCFDSFKYRIFDDGKACIVKFASLGAGHFPMYYSFCVVFVDQSLQNVEPLQHLIEDDGVFVYLYLDSDEKPLEYFVGTDPDNLKKAYLDEPEAIPLQINDNTKELLEVDVEVTALDSQQVTLEVTAQKNGQSDNSTSTPVRITSPTMNGISTEQADLKSADVHRIHNQFTDNINFGECCADTKTMEEEKLSLSESELLLQMSHSSSTSRVETHSDLDNHSWIVESKSAKKARRKKRSMEKKDSGSGNENHANSKSDNDDQHDNVFPPATQPIDIQSAYKYADKSGRGILKKNRSFSESSGDELSHIESGRSFSVDDMNFSSDSYSHSAPKKSVTFNDVISKKLYSSDISILEQRKRTKRRTQRKERRASESDTSETECTNSTKTRQENIKIYNENLQSSETELTSVSESGETSDDQSDTQETSTKLQNIPCSKKNHKRKGKKSARKNASTAKHNNFHGDF